MKTMLNADGNIGIPDEIRQTENLAAGDSFELERLTPGHYLLMKQQPAGARFTVATSEDGLPVIRTGNGVIVSVARGARRVCSSPFPRSEYGLTSGTVVGHSIILDPTPGPITFSDWSC